MNYMSKNAFEIVFKAKITKTSNCLKSNTCTEHTVVLTFKHAWVERRCRGETRPFREREKWK